MDEPIQLDPVLQSHATERIEAMTKIKKLRIKLSGVDNKQSSVSPGTSLDGALKTISQLEAPNVEMSFSMGRQEGTLNKIKSIIAAIGVANSTEAQTVEVTGIRDDDERDIIDLLDYCMWEKADVTSDPQHRRVTYPSRQAALWTAWLKRLPELNSMFGATKQ